MTDTTQPPAETLATWLPESALIDALHISAKLSCDDRVAILREAQRLAALTRRAADWSAVVVLEPRREREDPAASAPLTAAPVASGTDAR